jgi:hypothetical protein
MRPGVIVLDNETPGMAGYAEAMKPLRRPPSLALRMMNGDGA